jgi:hypothetical protein
MKNLKLIALSAIVTITACSKNAPSDALQTSKLNINPKTIAVQTGGNGNGENPDEFTRYYEIHEGNGTIDCISNGKDCKVKASTKLTTKLNNQLELLINSIKNNSVSDYFNGTEWNLMFPELESDQITLSKLKNGNLFLVQAPSIQNSYCFVLSNSKIYNSNDILKVWYWTVEETALKNIIGCSAVYDRHAEISETGTRVDCTTSGQDCNVGNITSLNLSQQISIFDNYYNNGNIKKYFLNEKWTLLFPNLNDNWLNSILMNEYKFIKLENSNTISFVLTDVSTETLNNQNIIHTWMFQN